MTTGKDMVESSGTITLPIPEQTFWTMLVLAGVILASLVVYTILPRTGETRMAQKIEALKSWLGFAGASRLTTTVIFGLGLVYLPLFAFALAAAFLIIWEVITGIPADPGNSPGQSLGFGALLVALISAPFVIWRSIVAQKTVDVTEQGLITDRINAAVAGLGAERKVDQIGRPVVIFTGKSRVLNYSANNQKDFELPELSLQRSLENIAHANPPDSNNVFPVSIAVETWPRSRTTIEWQGKDLFLADSEAVGAVDKWQIFSETLPNMEVRIGAIYALERIARENLDFHVQIMEILCAYIRENSPAEQAEPLHMPQMPAKDEENPHEAWARWKDGYEDEGGTWHDGLKQALDELKERITTRTDIQAALEVLGRRTGAQRMREAGWPDPKKDGAFVFDQVFPAPPAYPKPYSAAAHEDWATRFETYKIRHRQIRREHDAYQGYRLDLRRSNLQGYDLSRLHLNGARFEGAKMQGAGLVGAKMQGAGLVGAEMQGAVLRGAEMQGANLGFAEMQGAVLRGAEMQGTRLGFAEMQGADLRVAEMQGANLRRAEMQGADLRGAKMQGADLRGAKMQGANLRVAEMQGADLRVAEMQGADLRRAEMQGAVLWYAKMSEETDLTEATLLGAAVRSVDDTTIAKLRDFWEDIFADGTVQVPDGQRPGHWPGHKLDFKSSDEADSPFHIEWRRWLADPEGYIPPDPPED
ncbi:pentapeptide repeat-containing protein [Rhodophyticola sp. CCM32]|uniref:pentapeptide repeat-containing protein n=1 Tax=Rhodophyticola sp. CCM32 TaxID=2916397 RepID=UPI00107F18A7|nr:pentapeptide repeat-containing protein [Rhodophyticola sp. CCM32]QBX99552.1 pentapeptide repeat-containing protein [Rhodophyticola sp. CCM32]